MKRLHFLLATLATLIFFLIVVGGLVRNLGAGLSCPDWPMCQGRIIPVFDIRVFAEWFHRLFAGSVSLLTLGLSIFIFMSPDRRRLLGRFATAALLLLASQVVLGGLTVLQLLKSEIVTLHLATGTLFFATVLLMTMRSRRAANVTGASPASGSDARADAPLPGNAAGSKLALWSSVALFVLYMQIILGGVVSSHNAGLACPDFPKCLGAWWPGVEGLQGIHFIHRLGATTVFIVVTAFVVKLLSSGVSQKLRRTAFVILGLLIVQVTLGISNVLFHLPVPVDVAHLAVAEALFALILMSTYEIRHFQLR